MTEWINLNNIKGELSEDKFLEQVREQMTKRVEKEKADKNNYGNDGNVEVYKEDFISQGIKYQLKVIRYFAVSRDSGFPMRDTSGMNSIGKWVVVETDNKLPYDIGDLIENHELLWHDTLHSGMENWTLQTQWATAKNWAEEDCKEVLKLESIFNEKVKNLRKELKSWLKQVCK